MNIVITDGYTLNPGDLSWDALNALGTVTVYDRTANDDSAELVRRCQDADIIFVNKVLVTRAVLEQCPKLKLIVVTATGYNVIDTVAAAERGIPVCNVPSYGTAEVAQHTIALLLELCNHVGHHDKAVQDGRWITSENFYFCDYPIFGLAGKTFGCIGFGAIGRAAGALAKAFGMKVLATGSRPTAEGEAIADYVDLDTLLQQSDVISLHCPLFPATQGVICKENIAKMKSGILLLNTARGGLVVEDDLLDALKSGKIAAAGLDVISAEPMSADNVLLHAPNCIITPHIAWASQAARKKLLDIAVQDALCWAKGQPQNVVNA